MGPRTHFTRAEDDKEANDMRIKQNAGRTGKDGQMNTTEQDDNRTAGHPLSTLTQQGGLSQIKAGMKTRERS